MKRIFLFFILLLSTFGFSQSEALKNLLQNTHSLQKTENYAEAKQLFKTFEKQNTVNLNEKEFAKTYLLYYDYLISEDIKYLDNAINIVQKWPNRKPFQTDFLLKLYTEESQVLGAKENWDSSLDIILKGYNLPDFKQASLETKTNYLNKIGNTFRECYNPFEAIVFFKKSLTLITNFKGENIAEVAHIYNKLGDCYVESYNPTKGNDYYKKAILILEKISTNKPKDIIELLEGYRNLIRNLVNYGAKEDASIYLKKLNLLFKKQKSFLNSGDFYLEARQLQIHANTSYYSANAKFDVATIYCDSLKTKTIFKKQNKENINFLVSRYYDIIDYTYDFEKYDLTIELANKLLPLINQFDLAHNKMLIHAKLGTSYEKIKDYKKALYHIEIADKIIDQQNFTSSKFSIKIIKAIILSEMKQNTLAIDISKNTLEQLVFEKTKIKTDIETIKYENVAELADYYFINIFQKVAGLYLAQYKKNNQQKNLKIAENLYQIAGKLFQQYYLKGEFNDFLSYYHNEIVQGLLECTLYKKADFNQKVANLNLIERNASQHLMKEFDKKIKRKSLQNTNYLDKIKELKSELVFYKNQNFLEKNKRNTNEKQIKILQNNIAQLTNKISETEKNYSKFSSDNFDLNEVIKNLKKEEQLLKYYVCNANIYAVMFNHNSIEIKRIANRKSIENQVKNYLHKIQDLQSNSKIESTNLCSVLMPFQLKNKITIISDNFLNYLPFETLMQAKTQKFVVENHVVSYDYSLPMWLLHFQSKESNNNPSLAVFSPFYNQKAGVNRSDFKDLKFANIESQKIAKLFDGTLFAKEKATKSNFIEEKENFDIFHLSMHSQLFEDDFNKSCLVFSNEERLYFSELYGMNIPASLVVLSACDTGNGALKNGEGIMSMSRALTYAGVQSAVVSLWQVPDKETAEIMISFYENLKKGEPKDEALANAKITFIENNPMKNQPYYWAGFVVNGDISAIANKNYTWMILAGIALILLLFFLFRKK